MARKSIYKRFVESFKTAFLEIPQKEQEKLRDSLDYGRLWDKVWDEERMPVVGVPDADYEWMCRNVLEFVQGKKRPRGRPAMYDKNLQLVNVRVEPEIVAKIKESGLSFSTVVRQALREYMASW